MRILHTQFSAVQSRHTRMAAPVEQMLALHQRRVAALTPHEQSVLAAQIAATDRQIDRLVYALHGLTEDEVWSAEGGCARWPWPRIRREPHAPPCGATVKKSVQKIRQLADVMWLPRCDNESMPVALVPSTPWFLIDLALQPAAWPAASCGHIWFKVQFSKDRGLVEPWRAHRANRSKQLFLHAAGGMP